MKKLAAALAIILALSSLAACSGGSRSRGADCTSLLGQKVTGDEQAAKACEDVSNGTGDFGCTLTSTARAYWASTDTATYAGVTGGTWRKGPKSIAHNLNAIRKLAGC